MGREKIFGMRAIFFVRVRIFQRVSLNLTIFFG